MNEYDIKFYTVNDFSKLICVKPAQVRKMIKSGEIKAVKLTNGEKSHWIIPSSELHRLHAKCYLDNKGE